MSNREGHSLRSTIDYIDEKGETMARLTWDIFGFDNATMDAVGFKLINSLMEDAAELQDEKQDKSKTPPPRR